MSRVTTVSVEPDEAGLRLDRWFKRRFPGLSHGRLQKLLRTGQVRVDGGRAKAGLRLEPGQAVRVPPLGDEAMEPRPKSGRRPERPTVTRADARAIRARVIHRDDHVIVLDKPPGLAVQGGTGTHRHVDAMLDALTFDADERPRLVHRLDKDTSGVLLLARTRVAARHLTGAFRSRRTRKLYWAVVVGAPRPAQGRIDQPLAKGGGPGAEKVAPREEGGKRAVTLYRTIERAGNKAAWLALEPLTGRTHQLRVHCRELGTPVVGDGKYGGAEAFLIGDGTSRKLHLHARSIRIAHPAGGTLEVSAPLPEHMRATWDLLGFDEKDLDAGFSEED